MGIRIFPTLLLLFLFTGICTAQQFPEIQFSGDKMRAPLALEQGTSTLSLCGLTPGNTYKLIAVPMASGQQASFELAPAPGLSAGACKVAFLREGNQSITFSAPQACLDIQIKASSPELSNEVPAFLSIVCESCSTSRAWVDKLSGMADLSLLEVQSGQSAQQLIENVLVGGGCFQISNVTYQGMPTQIGTFTNGSTNIGFDSGIILATGNIELAPGPNDANGSSFGFGILTPDAELGTLASANIYDRANIEFDFIPTQNTVSFEFVFASEEYCEYVNTAFNDVFGFFISGPGINGTQNIALVPNTNTPVTINTINHIVNSGLYVHSTPIVHQDCPSVPPNIGIIPQEIQYDGFTKKLVAIANVTPCQTYHIKLKIADAADGVWDSAVFLKANSFDAGGEALATPAYPGGGNTAYESCDAGSIRFSRGNGNLNLPLPVNFIVGGTAVPGVDYVPLTNPAVIPAGQTEIIIPIQVLADGLPEGPENIQLVVPNSCSCSQGVVEFVINDNPVLTASMNAQSLCVGETATLTPAVSGGLPGLSYLWSTGETTAAIQTQNTGVYTVEVTDGCGIAISASAEVVFNNCACNAETYIKTLGSPDGDVRGYGVYDSKDGNLYITGSKQDSVLLLKMSPAGTLIWSRTFDVNNGVEDYLSDLIVDSEGMIAGLGQSGPFQPGAKGFILRYNPNTGNILWLSEYGFESAYTMGLLELPNGNYLVYDNPHSPTNDNRLMEITRSDGTVDVAGAMNQKLHLGSADNFNAAVIHNGKLFGVGRYTNGVDFTDMRHALSRIDLATGNVDWARLGHVAPGEPARLYGMDLLIEDNSIYSVGYGSEQDDNLSNSLIFLYKHGLGGNLQWAKRFNFPEALSIAADELISLPDGFLILAHDLVGPGNIYLIKTDKNGSLAWTRKVDLGFDDFLANLSNVQSQILVQGNHLFLVASTRQQTGPSQMLIAKTSLFATVDGNCDLIQPAVSGTSIISNPVNLLVAMQQLAFTEEFSLKIEDFHPTAPLALENQCEVLVEEQLAVELCPGESLTIEGVEYTQDTTFTVFIEGIGGCDTLRSYTIAAHPYPTKNATIVFCEGGSVTINGQVYTQPGVVIDTLPASIGCDTIATFTLIKQPYQIRTESISFCAGSSVTIGGQVYTQSAVVIDTLSSATACDTIVTYTLTQLPQPVRNETIEFCPGESIVLGGNVYTQPGVVQLVFPAVNGGCDTMATFTLVLSTPAPSQVTILCPSPQVVALPNGSGGVVVNYQDPVAGTNCVCPGLDVVRTSGPASGATFPEGATSVCFEAKDACGQSASCCFTITVGEDEPCDTKVAGCVKYELLTITEDAGKNRTYRIRVTNICDNRLIYTAIQIPSGLVAMEPANDAIYTAPSGNAYKVRSPNFSPQYSIRYSSVSDGIHNGESDIFKYTLPAQANVTYIHVISKLSPNIFLAAHLNTFYCPIGVTPTGNSQQPGEERDQVLGDIVRETPELMLFPNPTGGELYVDFSAWAGQVLQVRVLDAQGRQILQRGIPATEEIQLFDLPERMVSGLYILEMRTEAGERYTSRFVVER